MSIHTRMRKALVGTVAVASAGLALQGAPAADAAVGIGTTVNSCHKVINSENASDLSPSSQRAWAAFICGGGRLTGGAARMVSGAWIGSPTIIASATGQPLTADQKAAWEDWNEGGHNVGRGAALLVSGAYVGAPGVILDQIKKGATPTDLSSAQMRQVSFAVDPTSQFGQSLPGLPEVPGLDVLDVLPISPTDLLALLQGF